MFATPASSGRLPYIYQPYQATLGHDSIKLKTRNAERGCMR